MTKLYLTRHGETEWNKERRFQGQLDSKLTDLGLEQASWLGESLVYEDFDVIISSSSTRAFNTASIIKGNRNLSIIENDNLKEIHMGDWQGRLHKEIAELYPEQEFNFWNRPDLHESETGESISQFYDRVTTEIEKIIKLYKDKKILVVAHGLVVKVLMGYFEERELKDIMKGKHIEQTSLSIVEIDNGTPNILAYADTSHYKIG